MKWIVLIILLIKKNKKRILLENKHYLKTGLNAKNKVIAINRLATQIVTYV